MSRDRHSDLPSWFAAGVGIVVLLAATIRLMAVAPWPEESDSINFINGLARYSVFEIRPQWPGYPVYIWVGRLFALAFSDGAAALHAVSVAASTLVAIPIADLAAGWSRRAGATGPAAALAGIVAGAVWALAPLGATNGVEIMSDPLAALGATALLAIAWRARDRLSPFAALAALTTAGLLAGVRLPVATAASPAVLAVHRVRREIGRPGLAACLFALMLPAAAWMAWMVKHDGVRGLWVQPRLARHLESGGGSLGEEQPWRRPVRFLRAFSLFAIGGWWRSEATPARAVVSLLVVALAGHGVWRLARRAPEAARMAAAWIVPYLVFHGVVQAIDLPRYHFLPLALVSILVGVGLPWARLAAGALAGAALVSSLATVTVPIARLHARSASPGLQFAAHVARLPRGARLLLVESVPGGRRFTAAYAPFTSPANVDLLELTPRARALEKAGRTVYATAPAPDRPQEWQPVARFCPMAPYESDGSPAEAIWLFRHLGGEEASAAPVTPPCAPWPPGATS